MSRKRFTDADKWEDTWFSELSDPMKLFWIYLCDQCDQGGVWQVNWRLAGFHVALPTHEKVTAQLIADGRIVVFADGKKWFIPRFLTFQYPTGLSEKCIPHKRIISTLLSHGIDPITRVVATLPPRVVATPEDEDEDEDEDVFKGVQGETAPTALPAATTNHIQMPKSFPDWLVMHARVFVTRDDRSEWEALFRKVGHEVMSQAHADVLPTIQPGKMIFLTILRDYILSNFREA